MRVGSDGSTLHPDRRCLMLFNRHYVGYKQYVSICYILESNHIFPAIRDQQVIFAEPYHFLYHKYKTASHQASQDLC